MSRMTDDDQVPLSSLAPGTRFRYLGHEWKAGPQPQFAGANREITSAMNGTRSWQWLHPDAPVGLV
jgi:hypothetical protein